MQTNRSIDPMDSLYNCQEEKVPSVPFLLHSRIPALGGASIWIDRVAQRDIFTTLYSDEESHYALPSPASPTLPQDAYPYLNNVVKVHPGDAQPIFIPGDPDRTDIPPLPPQTIWHYETSEYEAESSLSSLSIIANGSPVPPCRTRSPLVQCIWAACVHRVLAYRSFAFKLLERLRWWLLIPGRLEFLFWLGGAILLMSSICIFLFITPVAIGWTRSSGPTAFPAAQQSVASCPSVHPNSALMKLLLLILHG
ncbi:MAG TPA: hypothetical protein VFA10_27430 [Ktedonobacteraceae bacterium]|nr:hypothetical protein [Ktedonobacteraceae bacterium]